jgi:hypothetical protein
MVRICSGKDVYDDVPESSTRRRGAFHPPVPPPSPPIPPASLVQLLAPLNAIMQRLDMIDEHQARQSQHHQHTQESFYFDFLATQPPKFTEMTDPLEANYWLCMIESKFGLLHCSEFLKTLFVVQQLCGSTSAWWAMYTAAIQDNHQVLWDEFYKAFRGHHLPAGTMHRNLREFLDLQQGTDDVYEYIRKFNYLAQYGTHHVDIDEKAKLFRKKTEPSSSGPLVQFHDMSFNALVSVVIVQDSTYQPLLAEEEEKRKRDLSEPTDDSTEGAPLKYHLVYTPSFGKS